MQQTLAAHAINSTTFSIKNKRKKKVGVDNKDSASASIFLKQEVWRTNGGQLFIKMMTKLSKLEHFSLTKHNDTTASAHFYLFATTVKKMCLKFFIIIDTALKYYLTFTYIYIYAGISSGCPSKVEVVT